MAKNMEPIELPVLFVPEEDMELYNIVPDSVTPENRPIMFFNINGITPYIDPNGNSYTEILCNGDGYICPLPYEEAKKMIK